MRMQRAWSRMGRAGVCVALAAAVLCGCGQQPASQSAPPAEQAASLYNEELLNDGILRVLYTEAGNTVLCGSKVLHQGSPAETVSLLQDEVTGETGYYMISGGQEDDPAVRTSRVYDRTGALVYDCGSNSVASLAGGKLLLHDYVGYDFETMRNYDYRMVDLATGEELPLPEAAHSCFSDGAGNFLAVIAEQAGAVDADSPEYWTSYNQMCYRSTTVLYDGSLQQMACLENCRGSQIYDWFGSSLVGWVLLEFGTSDEQEDTIVTKLYCPATGEMIDDFVNFCGRGLICAGTEEAGYRVRRLDSPTVLGEYAWPCELYLPEVSLVWRSSGGAGSYGYGYYEVKPDSNGYYEAKPGSDDLRRRVQYDCSQNTAVLMFEDGELCIYDLEGQAAPLLRTQVELPANLYRASVSAIDGSYASIACYDNDYNTICTLFYGPEGLLYRRENPDDDFCYYLANGENGPVFSAGRDGPGGTSLTDVIDTNGNVLCSGLAFAYQDGEVPAGIFRARKGFLNGWMTASGEWAYCESIFRTLGAEDGRNYYW